MYSPLFDFSCLLYFVVTVLSIVVSIILSVTMAASYSDDAASAFDILSSSPSVTHAPNEVFHGNQRWRKFNQPENRYKGSKISQVWSLGQAYMSVINASKKAWRCGVCGAIMLLSGDNSSNAAKHLHTQHNIQLT